MIHDTHRARPGRPSPRSFHGFQPQGHRLPGCHAGASATLASRCQDAGSLWSFNTLEKSVDLFWLEWVISWMDIWKRGKTLELGCLRKNVSADSERYLQFIMLEILIFGICKIHSGCRNIPGKVSGGEHVLCKAQAGVPEDWQKRRPLWWFQELKNGFFSAYFLGWMMCFLSLAPKKKGH